MAPKIIATITCTADLRTDMCPLRLGHEYEIAPIEKCLKCEYSETSYTTRGKNFKNRLISQKKSWDKQFRTPDEEIK